MIDISRERLITFAEAARLRPPSRAGRPTHVATVHRWRHRGHHGVRLETGSLRLHPVVQRLLSRPDAGRLFPAPRGSGRIEVLPDGTIVTGAGAVEKARREGGQPVRVTVVSVPDGEDPAVLDLMAVGELIAGTSDPLALGAVYGELRRHWKAQGRPRKGYKVTRYVLRHGQKPHERLDRLTQEVLGYSPDQLAKFERVLRLPPDRPLADAVAAHERVLVRCGAAVDPARTTVDLCRAFPGLRVGVLAKRVDEVKRLRHLLTRAGVLATPFTAGVPLDHGGTRVAVATFQAAGHGGAGMWDTDLLVVLDVADACGEWGRAAVGLAHRDHPTAPRVVAFAQAGFAPSVIPVTVGVPWGVPVLADRAYESDPLQERLDLDGFRLLARHRRNRTKPSVNDGRRLRRLRRRWVVERSFAWLKSFQRVATRYERLCHLYDGFLALACAFIAVRRL